MKVLVTGAGGMLGSCLVEKLKESHQVIATEQYPNNYNVVCMDITSPSKVKKVIKEWEPDFVIHCAAMTDVDGCETDPQSAFAVNGVGTYNVAMACQYSWYAFARELLDKAGLKDVVLNPIKTNQLANTAKRPMDSRICIGKYNHLGSLSHCGYEGIRDYLAEREAKL